MVNVFFCIPKGVYHKHNIYKMGCFAIEQMSLKSDKYCQLLSDYSHVSSHLIPFTAISKNCLHFDSLLNSPVAVSTDCGFEKVFKRYCKP